MIETVENLMSQPKLKLNGFNFSELQTPAGVARLDQEFVNFLDNFDPPLLRRLVQYRDSQMTLSPVEISDFLIQLAPYVETYLIRLFDIADAVEIQCSAILEQAPIFVFKEWFVKRKAKRLLNQAEEFEKFNILNQWINGEILENDLSLIDVELSVARLAKQWLTCQDDVKAERLVHWCVQAMSSIEGQQLVKDWVSFKLPNRLDYEHLVPVQSVHDQCDRLEGPQDSFRERDGFKLTDQRMGLRQVLSEIDYCVYCHEKDGDFCSKGFPVKKGQPELGLKQNPLNEYMTGCPLEEKISEMHILKKRGQPIASLAMVMLDNPMCPVTGHRICNDCMKACIYQKQDPVNIPEVETRVLTDVLDLPWGVEIYDLLTRWNPLKRQHWALAPYNGLKVLVMGMGPAGFTLAHYLTQAGFAVVGCDGLKIEPLPEQLIKQPIYRFADLKEALDERIMTGFGGVAEYGITVRWDKNFLKLIYISLMRNQRFQVFGGVRFGGTLKVEDVMDLGFDHLALAVGAGLPRELPIPGSMAPGMRQANDFLMALQLTGAAKKASLANLQLRLPAVVIGGGLTGVDAATEAQAYYLAQIEKTLERYETLQESIGEARVREYFKDVNFEILEEFLRHGRELRSERQLAEQEQRQPNLIGLIRQWGGVTIVYRRQMSESPAYRRNHEELIKALEEGIYYAEGLEPKAARLDKYGHVESLVCLARVLDESGQWILSDQEKIISARSILVATGAKPNIAYEFEHRGAFKRDGMNYSEFDEKDGKLIETIPGPHVKTKEYGPFTSYNTNGFRVSFMGDTHPVFHGSVVKAIASAKRTFPKIYAHLKNNINQHAGDEEYQQFSKKMTDYFSATIHYLKRHTPSVIELVVRAPMAMRNFQPGQFYRVQNYETYAACVGKTLLQTEALAMLGSQVKDDPNLLSLMILEKGASSRLFATLKPGDPISVMGPTGVRTKISEDKEVVMVIGGRMGAQHIRSVGPALKAAGNRVLYIAGFRTKDEVYCQAELEQAADQIVWITEAGEPITPRRLNDRSATGDFMTVLHQFAKGELDPNPDGPFIPLNSVDRVIVVGTQKLVRMVQGARSGFLQEYLIKNPKVTASIYGPMQCMLKGVCAQCLQWQIDPQTGKRTKAVYACSWHDQPLDIVDLDNLDDRLAQNQVQEILSNLWLDHIFSQYDISRL